MTTELAVHDQHGTGLAISREQVDFTAVQMAALAHIGIDQAPEADRRVFLHYCQRTGLDPFARQAYMIHRTETVYLEDGSRIKRDKWTIQTGIDGFRLTAHRAAKRDRVSFGQRPVEFCTQEGDWRPVWSKGWGFPLAARFCVERDGQAFYGLAMFDEYVPTNRDGIPNPNRMWRDRPAGQLAKCFDSETQVLTDHGFMRFEDITSERVMQVTPEGIEPVQAAPFAQHYDGPMIGGHGDMLDYSVTPNHDMLTTAGKVEAADMLAVARPDGVPAAWRVPFTHDGSRPDNPIMSDDDLIVAAAVVADGYKTPSGKFKIGVSRPYKVEALAALEPTARTVTRSAGTVAVTATREVRTRYDKDVFTFPAERVAAVVDVDKTIDVPAMLGLSPRQIRVFIDTWIQFDGAANKRDGGVRRLFTSRLDHLRAAETLAVAAGYSVNVARERTSDISQRTNWCLTVSEPKPQPVVRRSKRRPGVSVEPPPADKRVWCVTVPSGVIVVRRHGFSFLCGNCAEALALRAAFPQDLSGMYIDEEMEQADAREARDGRPVQAAGMDTVRRAAQQRPADQAPPTPSAAQDTVTGHVVEQQPVDVVPITEDQRKRITGMWADLGVTSNPTSKQGAEDRLAIVEAALGFRPANVRQLSMDQADALLRQMSEWAADRRRQVEREAAEADLAAQAQAATADQDALNEYEDDSEGADDGEEG